MRQGAARGIHPDRIHPRLDIDRQLISFVSDRVEFIGSHAATQQNTAPARNVQL
jgi:hypothetical protein